MKRGPWSRSTATAHASAESSRGLAVSGVAAASIATVVALTPRDPNHGTRPFDRRRSLRSVRRRPGAAGGGHELRNELPRKTARSLAQARAAVVARRLFHRRALRILDGVGSSSTRRITRRRARGDAHGADRQDVGGGLAAAVSKKDSAPPSRAKVTRPQVGDARAVAGRGAPQARGAPGQGRRDGSRAVSLQAGAAVHARRRRRGAGRSATKRSSGCSAPRTRSRSCRRSRLLRQIVDYAKNTVFDIEVMPEGAEHELLARAGVKYRGVRSPNFEVWGDLDPVLLKKAAAHMPSRACSCVGRCSPASATSARSGALGAARVFSRPLDLDQGDPREPGPVRRAPASSSRWSVCRRNTSTMVAR